LGGSFSQATNDAVVGVIAKGVIFLVAAGNSNADACNTSPASAPGVITVGATTITDDKASFSNWGKCVDVWAPGNNIVSAYATSDTTYASLSGTSMATPLAAGSVGLMAGLPSHEKIANDFVTTCTAGVIKGLNPDSINLLIYDRHADGTTQTCV